MLLLEKRLVKFGIKPGLKGMTRLCDALGNPQDKMKVILITGTNGKGSVTSYLAGMLKEAGYRIGAYYSPHIFRYNERFQINGKQISDAKFRKYGKEMLALLKHGYGMTLFEALTAIAYKYFADEKCDFAVMEIGMGGMYDATNVAEECISIITNVDFDHVEYLGSNIEQIARDKAGIIKKGTVITGADSIALETIREEAGKRKIPIKVLNEDFFAKIVDADIKGNIFNYIGESFYTKLETTLIGRYQTDNAALAVAAAEQIGIEGHAIRAGLKRARNPGRLEIISKRPLVVADGAHNPHAIKELIENLNLFRYEKLVCVFGCMKDKDWQEMLKLLAPHCDLLVTTQLNRSKRAADCKKLAEFANSYTKAIAVKGIKKAVRYAKKHAEKKGMVLICGSIYILADAITTEKRSKRPITSSFSLH